MDIFEKINNLENNLTIIIDYFVVVIVVMMGIYVIYKFHGKSIVKSIVLEKSLQQMQKNEKDIVVEKINRCVNRSTVRYVNNKQNVELLIPTKRLIELTSQVDIKQKIEEKLKSSAFRSTLNGMFPEYLFDSQPTFYKNTYILKGNKK